MIEFLKKNGLAIIIGLALVGYLAYVGMTGSCPSCLLIPE